LRIGVEPENWLWFVVCCRKYVLCYRGRQRTLYLGMTGLSLRSEIVCITSGGLSRDWHGQRTQDHWEPMPCPHPGQIALIWLLSTLSELQTHFFGNAATAWVFPTPRNALAQCLLCKGWFTCWTWVNSLKITPELAILSALHKANTGRNSAQKLSK
jgi:hypothetical protein